MKLTRNQLARTFVLISILSLAFVPNGISLRLNPETSAETSIQSPILATALFNNKTGHRIYLQLSGQQTKAFWLEPGKTKIEVEAGSYQYSFYADGGYETGSFKLDKGGTQINLTLLRYTLTIKSQISQTFYIAFSGPRNYYFQITRGTHKLDFPPGRYSYSFFVDGEQIKKEINLKSNSNLVLKLVRSTLRVKNNAWMNLYVTLTGPNNYSQTFGSGLNVISVIPGTYSYSYYSNGQYFSGTIKVSGTTESLEVGVPPLWASFSYGSSGGSGSNEDSNSNGDGGGSGCHPSYPTVCIPPPPPDLDCADVGYKNFTVIGSDPHGFDGDDDGKGCEW